MEQLARKILVTVLFIVTISDLVHAQPDWMNSTSREKKYNDGYITGFGQCSKSKDNAREEAEKEAIVNVSKNISISVNSNIYGEYYGQDNSDDMGFDEQSDSWFFQETSIKTSTKDIPWLKVSLYEDEKFCYAFAYIKRDKFAKLCSKKIDDELKIVKTGLRMTTKSLMHGKQDDASSQKERTGSHLDEIKKYQEFALKISDKADIRRDKVSAARKKLENVDRTAKRRVENIWNTRALVGSIFVPGLGLYLKHRPGHATCTLLGEIVFIGGGVASYYCSKQQLAMMQDPNVSFAGFQRAKKNYKICRVANITAISMAAALYVGDLFNTWYRDDHNDNHRTVEVYPSFIPTDEATAAGVGLTFNF